MKTVGISIEIPLTVNFRAYKEGYGDPSESRLWRDFIEVSDISAAVGNKKISLKAKDLQRVEEKASKIACDAEISKEREFDAEIVESLDVSIVRENEQFKFLYNGTDISSELSEKEKEEIISEIKDELN